MLLRGLGNHRQSSRTLCNRFPPDGAPPGDARASRRSPSTRSSPSSSGASARCRAGQAVRRRLRRPADPDLVVRVVAARDRARLEPALHPRGLGAERRRPRLGEHRPAGRGRVRAADRASRARLPRSTSPRCCSRRLGLDGLSPLPPSHRPVLALARRRLPVRLLELHARPRPRAAPADRHVRDPARRARARRRRSRGRLDRWGIVLRLAPLLAIQLYLSLEVGADADARARARARRRLPPRPALPPDGSCISSSRWRSRTPSPRCSRRRSSTTRSPSLRVAGFTPPAAYTADLLNFFLPTHLEAVGAGWAHSLSKHWSGQQHRAGRVRRRAAARDRRPLRALGLAHAARPVPARGARRRRRTSRSGRGCTSPATA